MTGRVSLVGAGPGDPELITLRGLKRLREADVVLYDRLASPILLEQARAGAELIDVGKAPGLHAFTQREIEDLLIEKARAGSNVVRLKGGDPFLFGRGGEEVLALQGAGIEVEVVPGISSALAGPAAAGIPVTHRNIARSVQIRAGTPEDEASGDTVVILMGIGRLEEVVRELIDEGRDASTPAAVVQEATLPTQRVVRAPLSELPAAARAEGVRAPAIIIVGAVVELSAPEPLVAP